MGGLDSLFGGREKVDVLTKDKKNLVNRLSKNLKGQLGESGPVYEGQIAPGTNPNIEAGFDAAGGLLAGDQNRMAAINQLLSGAGDIEGVNQVYQDSVVAPAQREFQDALRIIDDRYGDTWGTSGGQGRAVARATSDYGTGIASLLGQLVYGDRQAAADRQVQGVSASLGDSQDYLSRLNAQFAAGDYQRGIESSQNAEDYAKWEQGQAYNNPWLGFLGTALGTQTFGYGEESGLLQKAMAGKQAWDTTTQPGILN